MSVCLQGVSVWGSMPRGFSVGVSVKGHCCWRGLCPGKISVVVSVQRGFLSKESLSRGVSVQGDPPYSKEWVVCVLLEYMLVIDANIWNHFFNSMCLFDRLALRRVLQTWEECLISSLTRLYDVLRHQINEDTTWKHLQRQQYQPLPSNKWLDS